MKLFLKSFYRKGFSGLAFALILGALFVGCSRSSTGGGGGSATPNLSGWNNQPGGGLLWSVEQLHDELQAKADFVIIDARLNVADFDAGHIAGAIWIDWRDLANDPPASFPPSPAVEQYLGQQRGLEVTDQIVIYGDGALNRQAPFRLFWMLEYYGCTDVHLVDGGFQAWVQNGYDVDLSPWDPGAIVPKNFIASENNSILAVAAGIQDFVENQVTTDKVVIDARTPWEYSGEATEFFQDRAGRIPYSSNVWWLDGIDSDTGKLHEPERVRELLVGSGAAENKDNIIVATTGVRSTVIYFFCRLLGFPCRVYQGGLYNWSDVDNPPFGNLGLIERSGLFTHKSLIRGNLRPHFAGASAVYHDLIFTFGGLTFDPTNPPSTVNRGIWIFNPAIDPQHEGKDTDNWSDITLAASAPRFGHAASAVPSEDAIYLFGGATDTQVSNIIYRCVIDPFTHNLTQIVPLNPVVLPRKLHGLASVYNDADGLIYLFGGSLVMPFVGASDKAYVFTPASMGGPAIAEIASLPSGRTECGGVAVDGKIYCLGGEAADNVIFDEVLEYDPAFDTWVAVEPMSIPRLGVKGTVAYGRIYMAGGISEDDSGDYATGLVESFDPAKPSDGWRPEGEMAVAKSHHFMESVNNTIYMLGGYMGQRSLAVNNVNFLNVVEYKPEYKVEKEDLPEGLSTGGTAVLNGKVYLFGGNQDGTVTDKVRAYDPVANAYSEMDVIPYGPVRDACAVAIGNRALVFGGAADYSPSMPQKAAFLFDPSQTAGSQWTQVSDMPAAVYGAASAYYNDAAQNLGFGTDLVFAIGGKDINDDSTVTSYVYDVAGDTWYSTVFGDLPRSRSWAAAAVIGDMIYLTGGAGEQGLPLPDTLTLDLDPVSATFLQWVFLGAMPTARYGHASFVLGSKFFNIGGFVPEGNMRHVTDAIEVFDVATGRWTHFPGLDDAMALSFAAAAPNAGGGTSFYVIGGYVEYPTPIHFKCNVEMTP